MSQSVLKEKENQIASVIEKLIPLQQSLKNGLNNQIETLMLIGDTGAGKSTIFNWINGAEFEYSKQGNDKQPKLLLKSQENQDNYSQQNDGMYSVTKEPKFFHNKEFNHIVIDFPGFKDTQGWEQQLFVKLLFQEVVNYTKVKLVCVISNPQGQLINRGSNLQEMVQKTFSSDNAKFHSICFVLNQYMDEVEEEDLIESIQTQLDQIGQQQEQYNQQIYQALKKNIIIIRKVQKQYNKIDQVLSQENRRKFWKIASSTTPVQYTPKKIEHGNFISDYITLQIGELITQVMEKMDQNVQSIKSVEQMKSLIEAIRSQLQSFSNVNLNDTYTVYFQLFQKYYQCKALSKEFLLIFNFFFKYRDQIKGYQEFLIKVKDFIAYLQRTLNGLEMNLKQQQQLKQVENQLTEVKVTTAKNEKIMQRKLNQIEDQFEEAQKRNEELRTQNNVLEERANYMGIIKDQLKQTQEMAAQMEKNRAEEMRELRKQNLDLQKSAQNDQKRQEEVNELKKQNQNLKNIAQQEQENTKEMKEQLEYLNNRLDEQSRSNCQIF